MRAGFWKAPSRADSSSSAPFRPIHSNARYGLTAPAVRLLAALFSLPFEDKNDYAGPFRRVSCSKSSYVTRRLGGSSGKNSLQK